MITQNDITQMLSDHGIYNWVLFEPYPGFLFIRLKIPKRHWRATRKAIARFFYYECQIEIRVRFGVKTLHDPEYYLKEELK